MLLEEFESKVIFGVNNPNKKEAITLNLLKRDIHDVVISQCGVCNCHTSCRIGSREHPWRVHTDDIEQATPVLHLLLSEICEVISDDINQDWHAPELSCINISLFDLLFLFLFLESYIKLQIRKQLLIFFCVRVFLHQELLFESDDIHSHLSQHATDALLIVGQIIDKDRLFLFIALQISLDNFSAMTARRHSFTYHFLFKTRLFLRIDEVLRLKLIKWGLLGFFVIINAFIFCIFRITDSSFTTPAYKSWF